VSGFFDTVSMNIHRPVDGATSFEVGEGETASRGKLTTRIMLHKMDRTVLFLYL
jgi:hypothetical protein